MAKDPRLARAGVSGYNKPKRTPKHKTKITVVVAKDENKIKTIRCGQQGKTGNTTMTKWKKCYKEQNKKTQHKIKIPQDHR